MENIFDMLDLGIDQVDEAESFVPFEELPEDKQADVVAFMNGSENIKEYRVDFVARGYLFHGSPRLFKSIRMGADLYSENKNMNTTQNGQYSPCVSLTNYSDMAMNFASKRDNTKGTRTNGYIYVFKVDGLNTMVAHNVTDSIALKNHVDNMKEKGIDLVAIDSNITCEIDCLNPEKLKLVEIFDLNKISWKTMEKRIKAMGYIADARFDE